MVAQLDRAAWDASKGRFVSRLLGYSLFEGRPAVTRGRFINPLVLGQLRLATHLPGKDRVQRPVFIVGIGRSGTTFMGTLFGVHPDVGFLNEPKALWHVIHPGEDIIGSYATEPGRLRLTPADATPEVIERAHRLVSHYLLLSRSDRLVDKYPELLFRVDFVRAIFPDALFLIVMRRAWDTIGSIEEWSDTHRVDDADWWGVADRKWKILADEGLQGDPALADVASTIDPREASPVERSTVEWLLAASETVRLLARNDPGIKLVRYEDLVVEPADTMRDVLTWAGLSTPDAVLEHAALVADASARAHESPEDLAPALTSAVTTLLSELGYH